MFVSYEYKNTFSRRLSTVAGEWSEKMTQAHKWEITAKLVIINPWKVVCRPFGAFRSLRS